MHIPDGLIDPKISIGLLGAAAAVLSYCWAKLRTALTAVVPGQAWAAVGNGLRNIGGKSQRALTGRAYLMGMAAAIIFAAQLFDFPIVQGTTGHLLGGVLAVVLLGPFAGTVVISAVLVGQALFLGDGGVLTLGANIINLAFLGAWLPYYLYAWLKKYLKEWLSIGSAAWVSVNLAALAAAIEIGLFRAAAQSLATLDMLKVYLIIGLAEALITIGLVRILRLILPFRELLNEK